MAKNLIAKGERMNITAGADVASGGGVLVGDMLVVATSAIASGKTGAAATKGVWELPKLSTDVVAQGKKLYWDNTNKRLTLTSTDNTYAGVAYAAAGNGAATVQLLLNA